MYARNSLFCTSWRSKTLLFIGSCRIARNEFYRHVLLRLSPRRETDDGHVRRIIRCGNKKSSPRARRGIERRREADVQTQWRKCDYGVNQIIYPVAATSKSTRDFTRDSQTRELISRASKVSRRPTNSEISISFFALQDINIFTPLFKLLILPI